MARLAEKGEPLGDPRTRPYSRVHHPRTRPQERQSGIFADKGDKKPRIPTRPVAYAPQGGGGGGGGDGRRQREAQRKAYIHYYTRILNIKPNMKLVEKALKGNYTMQEFQLLVQREDADRYLTTWQGQQMVSRFRTLWARVFPSLNQQPNRRILVTYLKQRAAALDTRAPGRRYGHGMLEKAPDNRYHPQAYRNITNPTSMRDMYAFLSQTKLFRKIYPDFKGTKFEHTLDFAGYREYKRQFTKIWSAYTGGSPERADVRAFFRSDITPDQFEKNISTMLTGAEAYRYAMGQPYTTREYRTALFGRKGSQEILARVAAAYRAQEAFMQARPGTWGFQREADTGRLIQAGAY